MWNDFLMYNREFHLNDYIGDKNLHIGCGNKIFEKFINIDINGENVDLIHDLNKPLPYEENTIDLIFSDNVFEHIDNVVDLIQDCLRVLKPDSYLIIKVPYFKSSWAYIDLTHKNFFTIKSMDYFIKDKYANKEYRYFDESFSQLEILREKKDKSILRSILWVYAMKRTNTYENSIISNIYPIGNIIYLLKK